MTGVSAPTGLGQFDLGHLAFWARPEADRLAAFAELRQMDRPQFMPFINNMPRAPKNDGCYALVRHADVLAASRNPDLFSSEPSANSIA
ncbi:MAG TPA: hypothetical protein VH008_34985, partial [Pseudonocardia sp.]|nr:hypothetical protein [Pseudonocardia sp.]